MWCQSCRPSNWAQASQGTMKAPGILVLKANISQWVWVDELNILWFTIHRHNLVSCDTNISMDIFHTYIDINICSKEIVKSPRYRCKPIYSAYHELLIVFNGGYIMQLCRIYCFLTQDLQLSLPALAQSPRCKSFAAATTESWCFFQNIVVSMETENRMHLNGTLAVSGGPVYCCLS